MDPRFPRRTHTTFFFSPAGRYSNARACVSRLDSSEAALSPFLIDSTLGIMPASVTGLYVVYKFLFPLLFISMCLPHGVVTSCVSGFLL